MQRSGDRGGRFGTGVLCDLFGLSIAGAYRYTATVDHPGIAEHARPTPH